MLSKIHFFGKIQEQKSNIANKKLNLPDIPNDTYTKEKSLQNKADFTRDDIISILSSCPFDFLTCDLLKTGKYSDSINIVAFLENKTMGRYVGMAFQNFDTLNTERHNFTIPEFKEMLNEILKSNIENKPEKAEEFMKLYSQLLKKIETKAE